MLLLGKFPLEGLINERFRKHIGFYPRGKITQSIRDLEILRLHRDTEIPDLDTRAGEKENIGVEKKRGRDSERRMNPP